MEAEAANEELKISRNVNASTLRFSSTSNVDVSVTSVRKEYSDFKEPTTLEKLRRQFENQKSMDHCHSVDNQYFDSSQLPEKIAIFRNTKSYSSLVFLLSHQTDIQERLFWTVPKNDTMHFILSSFGIKILRGIFKYLRDLYKDKRHHGNLHLDDSIMVRDNDYFTKIDNLLNESGTSFIKGAIKDLGDLSDLLSRFLRISNGFLNTSISHLICMINTLQHQCDPDMSNASSETKADLIVLTMEVIVNHHPLLRNAEKQLQATNKAKRLTKSDTDVVTCLEEATGCTYFITRARAHTIFKKSISDEEDAKWRKLGEDFSVLDAITFIRNRVEHQNESKYNAPMTQANMLNVVYQCDDKILLKIFDCLYSYHKDKAGVDLELRVEQMQI